MKIKTVDAFHMAWSPSDKPSQYSAFVRIVADDGTDGLGEASPMQGGAAALGVVARDMAPLLIGKDPLDHAVLLDQLYHRCIKLGPEGIVTSALAALDIALWDIKGKAFGQPVHKLLGGAWRTAIPLYASIGHNGERTVDEVVRVVEKRLAAEKPALIKIRFDGDRTVLDRDVAGDIAKARAVRKLVGDAYPLAFDANNGFSVGAAIRVGRALEELGYRWFEEPVQHYHVKAMGEVARRLDITVSAGEQTYTLQALADLIDAGVRMVQPDIVKMGGITGMMQCGAVCHAHGVEFVPHQTQPTVGHAANLHVLAAQMHLTKPVEWNDPTDRTHAAFRNPPRSVDGIFAVPAGPGIGLQIDAAEFEKRKRPVS